MSDKMKIIRYQIYSEKLEDFSDAVACLAANVEDAYILCGIEDYTAKDCFDKAFELIAKGWTERNVNIGRAFCIDTRTAKEVFEHRARQGSHA